MSQNICSDKPSKIVYYQPAAHPYTGEVRFRFQQLESSGITFLSDTYYNKRLKALLFVGSKQVTQTFVPVLTGQRWLFNLPNNKLLKDDHHSTWMKALEAMLDEALGIYRAKKLEADRYAMFAHTEALTIIPQYCHLLYREKGLLLFDSSVYCL